MLLDSHCHAWRRWPYSTAVPDPDTRGSVDALLWEMDANAVEFSAVVCARIGGGKDGDGFSNEDNNEYVVSAVAERPDRLTAWVDVDCMWTDDYHQPGAASRLRDWSDRRGVTGFTHYLRQENDGWLRSAEAEQFFGVAAEAGLVASIACGSEWLTDLSAIASNHPSVPVLLHHLGHALDGDTAALVRAATVPSIGIKVSGFNYFQSARWAYPYPAAHSVFRELHAAFGFTRMYWGSDFPASRDAMTFRQSIEVVREHTEFLGPEELNAIMGGNLQRILHLEFVDS